MTLPHTESRVMEHTDPRINESIRRQLEARVYYYAQKPDMINDRLHELDEEWDIERILEANAAGVSLFGILMSLRNRKFLILPMVVASFLMQHALQGWCPPIEILRRLGVRTTKEINDERYALKVLRGDFNQAAALGDKDPAQKTRLALEAVEKPES